jgi:hypothetical protein
MSFDPTKPVRMADPEDKRSVRIIASDLSGTYPIVVAITDPNTGSEWTQVYHADGTGPYNGVAIVNVPETYTIEYYVNVLRKDDGRVVTCGYSTREEANEPEAYWETNWKRIACLHFTRTFEEGEGLNNA